MIVGNILITYKNGKDRDRFKKLYKEKVVKICLMSSFTDIEYRSDDGISIDEIRTALSLSKYDKIYSTDYIKAKYNDLYFESSDVIVNSSDSDYGYTNIFNGQCYVFKFNRSFKSRIKV